MRFKPLKVMPKYCQHFAEPSPWILPRPSEGSCRRDEATLARPTPRAKHASAISRRKPIPSDSATRKLVSKLAVKYRSLTFCYEAGPTGYALYRLLRSLGQDRGSLAHPEQARCLGKYEPARCDGTGQAVACRRTHDRCSVTGAASGSWLAKLVS